eukprot:m.61393 g.61393  ORF g.61393 m.61393 type:complete len:288 (-) comp13719_c0_seq1:397-1260(-)
MLVSWVTRLSVVLMGLTALAVWLYEHDDAHISQTQAVIEIIVWTLLWLVVLNITVPHVAASSQEHAVEYVVPKWMRAVDTVIVTSVIALVMFKIFVPDENNESRLPYILNPCNICYCIFGACLVWPKSRLAIVGMNFLIRNLWVPLLGTVFFDLGGYVLFVDKVNYFILHIFLIILPILYVWLGRFPVYTNRHWDFWAWGTIVSFHVYFVQAGCHVFGRNINQYMRPPKGKDFLWHGMPDLFHWFIFLYAAFVCPLLGYLIGRFAPHKRQTVLHAPKVVMKLMKKQD